MVGSDENPFRRISQAVDEGAPPAAAAKPDLGEWVAPIPKDAPAPLRRHSKFGPGVESWSYRSAEGRELFIAVRMEPPGLPKQVLPQTLWTNAGQLRWTWKAPPAPRPLYGLHELAQRKNDPVLVVEGEKTADAARILFPDYVVMTWQGGAKATGKAEWAPLSGRQVTVWPDADAAGASAARDIARLLKANAVRVNVVALPALLPEGWDLADPWPIGFSYADAKLALSAAGPGEIETTWPRGFLSDSGGLWWAPPDNGKGEAAPAVFLCAELTVLATARDEDGGGWSTVVEFRDPDGRTKRDIIGRGELAGEGIEVRRRLMDAGLSVSSNKTARERLLAALSSVTCSERVRLASAAGWRHGLYVLPHRTIGASAGEGVIYRGRAGATQHGHLGSFDKWREGVAVPAAGNALLAFAISCAFAGPLLRPHGGEGGGFHVRGESSTGKTTLLRAGGSVWGGGGELGFAQSWRNTDNALEAVGLNHNDGFLALDELKLLDANAAGSAAYSLASGVAKNRLSAAAELKPRPTWRVMILSCGEIGLSHLIGLGRNSDRTFAGQELRLLDLDADMGCGLGVWQRLHGRSSPAEFSETLRQATDQHYGHAGPMFVEQLIKRRAYFEMETSRLQRAFLEHVAEPGDTGQARRGAQRFALVAAAGEIATAMGLTGWEPDEAFQACADIFYRWAKAFGRSTQREDGEALQRVKVFLERYGDSRFRHLKDGLSDDEMLAEEARAQQDAEAGKYRDGEARSLDSAGYRQNRAGHGLVFHFHTEFWQLDLFKGMDARRAARALKAAGYLISNGEKESRLTNKVTMAGAQRNFYSISHAILNAELNR